MRPDNNGEKNGHLGFSHHVRSAFVNSSCSASETWRPKTQPHLPGWWLLNPISDTHCNRLSMPLQWLPAISKQDYRPLNSWKRNTIPELKSGHMCVWWETVLESTFLPKPGQWWVQAEHRVLRWSGPMNQQTSTLPKGYWCCKAVSPEYQLPCVGYADQDKAAYTYKPDIRQLHLWMITTPPTLMSYFPSGNSVYSEVLGCKILES